MKSAICIAISLMLLVGCKKSDPVSANDNLYKGTMITLTRLAHTGTNSGYVDLWLIKNEAPMSINNVVLTWTDTVQSKLYSTENLGTIKSDSNVTRQCAGYLKPSVTWDIPLAQ